MKLLLVNPSAPRRRFRSGSSNRGLIKALGAERKRVNKRARKQAAKFKRRVGSKWKNRLSPAQVAAGFGGKRRRAAAMGKRKKTKTSTKRRRAKNKGKSTMAIRRRRKKSVRLNPRRRRRVLRLNPGSKRRSRRAKKASKSSKRSRAARKAARTRKANLEAKAQKRRSRRSRRSRKAKTKVTRRRRRSGKRTRRNPSQALVLAAAPRRRRRRAARLNPGSKRKARKGARRRRRGTALVLGRTQHGKIMRTALKRNARSKSFRQTALAYSHARKAKKMARSPKEQAFLRAAGLAGVPNPGIGAVKGLVTLLPAIGVGGLGLVGTMWAGKKVAEVAADKLPASIPVAVKAQVPAITAGLLTVGGYLLARNSKALSKFALPWLIGGGAGTILLALLGIRVAGPADAAGAATTVSLAAKLGLPIGEYTRLGAAGGSSGGIFGEYTHTGGTDDDPQFDDLRGTDDDPQWDDDAGVLSGGIFD